MKRVSLVALGGGIAVLGLGGCVAFDGPIEGSQISENRVQVKFALCRDLTQGESECRAQERGAARGPQEGSTHVLLAFRMPRGTETPDEFSPLDADLLFERSRRYSGKLRRSTETDPDERWFGYISENYPDGSSPERARFSLRFGLPPQPGGVFRYRPVAGYITYSDAPEDPTEARIKCAEDPQSLYETNRIDSVCIDDPETERELERPLKIELARG